jgi:hypothetical protein
MKLCQENINTIASKLLALLKGPKHKIGIFSEKSPTTSIKFQSYVEFHPAS